MLGAGGQVTGEVREGWPLPWRHSREIETDEEFTYHTGAGPRPRFLHKQ